MQNLLNKLNGKAFKYCGRTYVVKETKIVSQKAVILTDGQSFVKTNSELEAFMEDIEIVKIEKFKDGGFVPKPYIPSDEVVFKSSPLQAEILVAESNASKVSNKLMEVFNSLADSPTEETYKKASAMVNVSNSIVAVQMAQIKFLSLKK
jgi:hypothetical protein